MMGSHTRKVSILLALMGVCGAEAAAADLPKAGTFTDTFYGIETFKGTGVGKTWYGATWELDAIVIGNGLRTHMTAHCYGIADRIGDMRSARGRCIYTDPDGDKIVADEMLDPFPRDAKDHTGHGIFITGTGKYDGITGEMKTACHSGVFRPAADNMVVSYCPTEGSYKLP
jgi:hypothetical protein